MHQKVFEYPGPFALLIFYQTLQFPQDMGPADCMTHGEIFEIAAPTIMNQPAMDPVQYGLLTVQRQLPSFLMHEQIGVK